MPYFTSVEPILRSANELLADRDQLAKLSAGLIAAARPLAAKKASDQVSDIVLEMLR
jgi:hypothetical protein